MDRLIKISIKAIEAITASLSTGDTHTPTQWLISGEHGQYQVHSVNDDLCGFPMFETYRSHLSDVKRFIEEANQTGQSTYKGLVVFAFKRRV